MEQLTRELSHDEEFMLFKEEFGEIVGSEKEGCEPPFANNVLRRALRCILKLRKELKRYEELEEANEQAKELVTVRISIFFEIKDAAIYGGIGSVGYSECAVSGNGKMLATNLQSYADGYKYDMASFLHIPEECVRIISKEEYEAHTEDEEEETEFE